MLGGLITYIYYRTELWELCLRRGGGCINGTILLGKLGVVPYIAETTLWDSCWGNCIVAPTQEVLCWVVIPTLEGMVLGISVGTVVGGLYCAAKRLRCGGIIARGLHYRGMAD